MFQERLEHWLRSRSSETPGFPAGFWPTPGDSLRFPATWLSVRSCERRLLELDEEPVCRVEARVEFPTGQYTATRPVSVAITSRGCVVLRLKRAGEGFHVPVQILHRFPVEPPLSPLCEGERGKWQRQRYYFNLDGKKYWVAQRAYIRAQNERSQ